MRVAVASVRGTHLDHDIEELARASIVVVRERRLDQVSSIIHLVHAAQVLESPGRVDDREVDVEVSVLLLRRGNHINELLDGSLELVRVRAPVAALSKEVAHGLDPARQHLLASQL